MAIQFTCTACGQPIEVDNEMADKAVTCPYCHKAGTAPATSTLDASAIPPTADTGEADGAGVLPYVGAGEAPKHKTSPMGWIALGCIVISALSLIYVSLVASSMVQDLNMKPTTPQEVEELQKTMQERMETKPGLMIISTAGSCVFPLAGVVLAIIALVKRYRPRWPAIVALSLVGILILVSCAGVIMRGGMGAPGVGG